MYRVRDGCETKRPRVAGVVRRSPVRSRRCRGVRRREPSGTGNRHGAVDGPPGNRLPVDLLDHLYGRRVDAVRERAGPVLALVHREASGLRSGCSGSFLPVATQLTPPTVYPSWRTSARSSVEPPLATWSRAKSAVPLAVVTREDGVTPIWGLGFVALIVQPACWLPPMVLITWTFAVVQRVGKRAHPRFACTHDEVRRVHVLDPTGTCVVARRARVGPPSDGRLRHRVRTRLHAVRTRDRRRRLVVQLTIDRPDRRRTLLQGEVEALRRTIRFRHLRDLDRDLDRRPLRVHERASHCFGCRHDVRRDRRRVRAVGGARSQPAGVVSDAAKVPGTRLVQLSDPSFAGALDPPGCSRG